MIFSIFKTKVRPITMKSYESLMVTFRGRPGRLRNALCTFSLFPVTTGCLIIVSFYPFCAAGKDVPKNSTWEE